MSAWNDLFPSYLERADIQTVINALEKLENIETPFVDDMLKKYAKHTKEGLIYRLDNPIVINSFASRDRAKIEIYEIIQELSYIAGAVQAIDDLERKKRIDFVSETRNIDFKFPYNEDWSYITDKLSAFKWRIFYTSSQPAWYRLFLKEFSTKPVGWVRFFLD